MKKSNIAQMIVVLVLGACLCWSSLGVGCAQSILGSVGMSKSVPSTPGPNPYIVLRFANSVEGTAQNAASTQPGRTIFSSTWRYAGGGKDGFGWTLNGLFLGEDIGTIIPCDISVLTVGDVDDLTTVGAWISWSGMQVRQDLPPMGKNLTNGVDFRCGDVVTFMLEPNSSIPQKFNVTWRVDSGQNEQGPYTGPDTFANLDKMTTQWEKDTGITIPYPYVP